MVELTRLNGHAISINCDLIKFAESAPDTMLTLVTGEKIMVRESCEQVRERVRDWRIDLLKHSGRAQSANGAQGAMHASAAHALAAGNNR